MGPRPERQTGRVRDEILVVLPELIDERGEFTMRQVQARLNPGNDARRGWAVEKAVQRMSRQLPNRILLLGGGCFRYLG